MYLDINLYAQVEDSQGADKGKIQITEAGTKISLTISLPEEMINSDNTVERTYKIIRVHNGKAEEIACEYDEVNGTVTFKTDRFSTYALAYEDTAKT